VRDSLNSISLLDDLGSALVPGLVCSSLGLVGFGSGRMGSACREVLLQYGKCLNSTVDPLTFIQHLDVMKKVELLTFLGAHSNPYQTDKMNLEGLRELVVRHIALHSCFLQDDITKPPLCTPLPVAGDNARAAID
jgi:hypothetical protein